MNKYVAVTLLVAALVIALIAGCDLFVNPLILDGSVTSGEVIINTNTTAFLGLDSLDLNGVVAKVDQTVDSVKFFNLTIVIDSLGSNTPDSTSISGAVTVDNTNSLPYRYKIVTLAGVRLSDFASERSVFDTTIAGFSYDQTGIDFLVQALKQNPPPVLYVSVQGSASHGPLLFRLKFKVYAQVYAKGK